MKKLLSLNIDQNDCFEIVTELEDNDYIMNLYNTIFMIYLHHQTEKYKVHRFAVGYDLYYLAEHIQKCINNQLPIPQELEQDIDLGWLWNEHTNKIILAEEVGSQLPSWKWVGTPLLFLENKGAGFDSCMTWLYNDENGNILLKVSSAYPWFFKDTPADHLYISYNEWLSSYKVHYKTIIPRDVAQKWVKDLQGLYAMLELNLTSNSG